MSHAERQPSQELFVHDADDARRPSETYGDHRSYSDVAARLYAKFGPGDNAALRAALFDRIQRECELHHDFAYRIVCGAVRSAETARDPGRYFCACIARRMREHGLLDSEGDQDPF